MAGIVHPDVSMLVSSPAKLNRYRAKSKCTDRLPIKSIEPAGRRAARCISIAHPAGLYITNDYVVTHNTMLVNAMLNLIPLTERLVIIEDAGEIQARPGDVMRRFATSAPTCGVMCSRACATVLTASS